MASIVVLEMNGEKVSKTLNYLPSNRPYYNVVSKGDKQERFKTAEETLSWLQSHKDDNKVFYVKVPSSFHEMALESLRIA